MKENDTVGILTSTRMVVLVSASDRPDCPNYQVMKYLLDQGYHAILALLKATDRTLLRQQGYATFADVPEKADMVDVFHNSEAAWGVTREAIAIDTKMLWSWLGMTNKQVAVLAREVGLNTVTDRCPAIELSRLGLAK